MAYNPLIPNSPISEVETLDHNHIITKYKKDYKMDVSSYFRGSSVKIMICEKSGYKFYEPKSLMADGPFYEELNKNSDGTYYPKKWEHYEALKNISPGSSILEIGCGDGNFFKVCKEIGEYSITGLELSKDCVLNLTEEGYTVFNNTIEEYVALNPKKEYDVVCAFQVLEHIYEVKSFIDGCLSLLKKNGILIFGVPNNNPYYYKWEKYHTLNLPPHHMGMWNEVSLKYLSKIFPLEVVYFQTEKLKNHKHWFQIQRENLSSKNIIFKLLYLIPRPVYKFVVKIFSPKIEGPYCLIMFKKTS
jgi:2-polyprenyl-3-methyl-5-hydroxy-6-metoxy-1,4-benzoquinol methylase